MTSAPGVLVTLEGGEGAGKSTLAHTLAAWIEGRGRVCVRTREPGGSAAADAIRSLIVAGAEDRWRPEVETLLLTAARADHVAARIRPALEAGAVVLCDRYIDSTRAYQAGARGVDRAFVDALHALIVAPEPDLTLLLDLPPALGLARSRGAAQGEDRFEKMALSFHAEVRAAFLGLAQSAPGRFVVLDATQPEALVAAQAQAALTERLGL